MRVISGIIAVLLVAFSHSTEAQDNPQGQVGTASETVVGFNPATGITWEEQAAPSLPDSSLPGSRGKLGRPEVTSQELNCCFPDNRIEIIDTTSFPYSTVCKVITSYSNGNYYTGSATMVGPRHAVTAGHVVYSAEDGGWPDSITVIPGFDGHAPLFSAPLGTYYPSNYYSLKGWTDSMDSEYDFGLLEFSSNVGNFTGWMGFAWTPFNGDLMGETLETAGYPAELESGSVMFYASGPCLGVADRVLTYGGTLDTSEGQSGSGIWVDAGQPLVVGVVTSGNSTYNFGTRITESIFNLISAKEDGTAVQSSTFRGQFPFYYKRWNRAFTAYGEYVSFEFTVNEFIIPGRLLSSLKFKVGPKGAVATVYRPDGTSFSVTSGKGANVYAPQFGTWQMLVHNYPSRGYGKVKVRVKPSNK